VVLNPTVARHAGARSGERYLGGDDKWEVERQRDDTDRSSRVVPGSPEHL
jgi:hypothetical protein